MKGMVAKILLVLLIFTLVTGGWTTYRMFVLDGEKKVLLGEVEDLERKIHQFKNKLGEERALVNQYARAKSALEGQLRDIEAQKAESEANLSKDKDSLSQEVEQLKKSVAASAKKAEKDQEQLEKYKEALGQWKTQFEALREESINKITERDEKITSLSNDKQNLDSQLSGERQQHDYCRRSNSRFAQLSMELVTRYQSKNIIDSLRVNEPLTQLEKIELEKIVQEYQDEIDKNTL